jgi:hypothetical protein
VLCERRHAVNVVAPRGLLRNLALQNLDEGLLAAVRAEIGT